MFIYAFSSALSSFRMGVPHTHDNHEFFFCIDGNCRQLAGEATLDLGAQELCLLPKGMPHCAWRAAAERPSTNWVINVDDEYLSSRQDGDQEAKAILDILCRRAYAGECRVPLGQGSRPAAREACRAIAAEIKERRPGWQAAAKARFIDLLCAVYRRWPAKAGPLPALAPGRECRMREVFAYIDNNYMKELMVEDLLPLAHLSRSRFHAVFAAEAGCSFKAYLNRLRIAQAERALAATALPVTQIALGCGYNSLSQFYAAFRALHGGSPCRFRREAAAQSPANPPPPPFHGQRKA